MNKQERIKVYENTIKIVNKGQYSKNNKTFIFDKENEMIEGSKYYGKKIVINHNELQKTTTEVKVVNNDCLYEAEKMIRKGLKPAVLNMASFHTPGGGVINGSSAQEEDIFRRTNIFKALYQYHQIGEEYNIKQKEERYPLDFNYGGIYTPSVTVFKGGKDVNYGLMDNPFTVDVITLPAVKKPPLEDGKIVPWAKKVITNKIQQILDIAIENGNDSLVLSAFGCGAYKTPPEEMALIFHKIIFSEEYKNIFKAIHFAIIDVPSTNGEHNKNGNIKPFKDVFE